MPRVTKADLERENADLERENAELKAELVQRRERSRSRSRRRNVQFVAAPMDATTRRALDVVRKHDRDGGDHRAAGPGQGLADCSAR